jgi:hypothetical protein
MQDGGEILYLMLGRSLGHDDGKILAYCILHIARLLVVGFQSLMDAHLGE